MSLQWSLKSAVGGCLGLIGLLGLNYDDMAMLRWTISAPLIMDGIKYFLGPEALRGRNFGYNFA